ncbi:hypothetical protein FB382_004377 [Nocardioides ginsengisegetis]|uniref:Uncharacterized protein n=1 Tax=Nocardioides ginsengisegetis TaxID=661491 RepID=A0A7W3J490_9ACTN|nr:hypothetical protein [Nocardioides ginsengisegetis]MBA8806026.1 hypothetical protein [Nocardioides ginsengisegetis]
MRFTLRFLGLDLIDFAIETAAETVYESDDQGSCTTYPIGFTQPEPAPLDYDCPDRDL